MLDCIQQHAANLEPVWIDFGCQEVSGEPIVGGSEESEVSEAAKNLWIMPNHCLYSAALTWKQGVDAA
jgi:hypothetical protein